MSAHPPTQFQTPLNSPLVGPSGASFFFPSRLHSLQDEHKMENPVPVSQSTFSLNLKYKCKKL